MSMRLLNPRATYFRRYLKPTIWNSSGNSTQTWTPGRVMLQLIEIPEAVNITTVTLSNGNTVAGNVTVGIYAEGSTGTPAGGALLGYSASTALSVPNGADPIALIATLTLTPGAYWIAVEYSDATHMSTRPSATQYFPVSITKQYDRAGGYGALTNPCPAVTDVTITPAVTLA